METAPETVALLLELCVARDERVDELVAVKAAEPVRLALGVALGLTLAVGVLRADRVARGEALPETAEEPETCAETLLSTLRVDAEDIVADIVSVSDTSVANGEAVAAALPVATWVKAAVVSALSEAAALEMEVELRECVALRDAEGDAVSVRLTLGLPVSLGEAAAVRLALALPQNV